MVELFLWIPPLCHVVMMVRGWTLHPCAAMIVMGMYLPHLHWVAIFKNLSWQYVNSMICKEKVEVSVKVAIGWRGHVALWSMAISLAHRMFYQSGKWVSI